MDTKEKYLIERLANIDTAIDRLTDSVGALRQVVLAEREVTARALAAMMARIEDLERK